jgi:hypothetical protein
MAAIGSKILESGIGRLEEPGRDDSNRHFLFLENSAQDGDACKPRTHSRRSRGISEVIAG